VGWLLVWTQAIYAKDSPTFQKIADVSPDGKFGLRISRVGEPEYPNKVNSALITASKLFRFHRKTEYEKDHTC